MRENWSQPLDTHDYIDYTYYMSNKTRPIMARLEEEEFAKLERLAKKEDRTIAYLVKQAIRVYLNARQAE